MANALKGEAALGDYTLAYTFGSFCELEDKTGKKMPQLMQLLQEGLGFSDLRDFIWAGLLKYHAMGDPEVADFLDDVGFEAASISLSEAIGSFFGEAKAKDKNPPKAK